MQRRYRCLWLGNIEILADPPCKVLIDFTVPRNGGGLPDGSIDIDCMSATLPEELTAMMFQMLDKVSALHETAVMRRSFRTSRP